MSLPVSRLSSGNRMEDRELHRRIDARRYPTIEGVLGRIERSGDDGTYEVSGDVTFRGVSRPASDAMTFHHVDDKTVQTGGPVALRHPRLRDGAAPHAHVEG